MRLIGKKGISAIVATVLIILITVAAVTIIWAVVLPMIKQNVETESFDSRVDVVTVDGYTVYDATTGRLDVHVRQFGNADRIEIIVSSNGNSNSTSYTLVPGNNQKKVYTLNVSDLGFKLDSLGNEIDVKVVPYITVGQEEKQGTGSGAVTVKSSTIIPDCTSDSECGTGSKCSSGVCVSKCNSPEVWFGGRCMNPTTGCSGKLVGDLCYNEGTCDANGGFCFGTPFVPTFIPDDYDLWTQTPEGKYLLSWDNIQSSWSATFNSNKLVTGNYDLRFTVESVANSMINLTIIYGSDPGSEEYDEQYEDENGEVQTRTLTREISVPRRIIVPLSAYTYPKIFTFADLEYNNGEYGLEISYQVMGGSPTDGTVLISNLNMTRVFERY